MTQIGAVRCALPAYLHRQAELTQTVARLSEVEPARRPLLERLHANAGVDTRATVLPLADYEALDGIGPTNDRYIDHATALGEQAVSAALRAAGVAPDEVDLLIVTSVTGVAVPSVDARLIPRLGLRPDVKRVPIFGLGCVAGAAGLARLHDYLRGWPEHTAVLLAVEVCSLTVPVASSATPDLVVSGLFGDGAVAVVARGEQAARAAPRGPKVIATHSEVCPGTEDVLGWRLGSEGFRIVLTAELAGVVSRHLGDGVRGFLAGHELKIDDVTAWVCHPGGPKVIATHSEVCPGTEDVLGWRLASEGFRIVLTAELAGVVSRHLGDGVRGFLAEHELKIDDVTAWVCHPGGPKVIDAVQESLGLPADALTLTRRSLAEVGNMSSASVLHVLEQTMAAAPPPGSPGVLIGLGPGVSVELILLEW